MTTYSFDEYTNVKHVMYDGTAAARKDWHRTIFGPTAEESWHDAMTDRPKEPR